MKEPEPKAAGTWDFCGACAPNELADGSYSHITSETFTLGCFQWVPAARGARTKKGKVQYRIKGRRSEAKDAFDAARAFCAKKNGEAQS